MNKKGIKQIVAILLIFNLVLLELFKINIIKAEATIGVDLSVSDELPFTIEDTTYGIKDESVTAKEIDIKEEDTSVLAVIDNSLILIRQKIDNDISKIYIVGHSGLIVSVNVLNGDENWQKIIGYDNTGTIAQYADVKAIARLETESDFRRYMMTIEEAEDPGKGCIHNLYYMLNPVTEKYDVIDATACQYYAYGLDLNNTNAIKADEYGYCYKIKKDNKYGLLNLEDGSILYECIYNEIDTVSGGMLIGRHDEGYAILSKNGKLDGEKVYDDIEIYGDLGLGYYHDNSAIKKWSVDVISKDGIVRTFANIYKNENRTFTIGFTNTIAYITCKDTVELQNQYDGGKNVLTESYDVYKCYRVSKGEVKDINSVFGGDYCEVERQNNEIIKITTSTLQQEWYEYGTPNYSFMDRDSLVWKEKIESSFYANNSLIKILDEENEYGVFPSYTYYFADNGCFIRKDITSDYNGAYEVRNSNNKKIFDIEPSQRIEAIGSNYIYCNSSVINVTSEKKVADNVGSYISDLENGYIFVFNGSKAGIIETASDKFTGYIYDISSNTSGNEVKTYRINDEKKMIYIKGLDYYLDEKFNKIEFDKNIKNKFIISDGKIIFLQSTNDGIHIYQYDEDYNLSGSPIINMSEFTNIRLANYYDLFTVIDDSESKVGYYDKDGKKEVDFIYTYASAMINGLACVQKDDFYKKDCIVNIYGDEIVEKVHPRDRVLSTLYIRQQYNYRELPSVGDGYYIAYVSGYDTLYFYDLTKVDGYRKKEVSAEIVYFNKATVVMNKGDSEMLSLYIEPHNYTDKVDWKSSDENIVTVDENGNVTALNYGLATVSVTVGAISANCNIIVPQPVTDIELNKQILNIKVSETDKLTVSVYPDNAYNQQVNWTTSDSSIVSINEYGEVKGISEGKAVITVSTTDGTNIKKTCEVNVEKNNNPEIIIGDLNGDGTINTADAVLIKKYLAGYTDLDIDTDAADINTDGNITSADAVILQKYLAGYKDVVLGGN